MERFPANSIQEPTAFTSHDPMEMYNNILVFIVSNSNPSYPPEMHIFQASILFNVLFYHPFIPIIVVSKYISTRFS